MTQETKQIFSIRKFSTGTHSALLGKASLALATTAILMGAAGAVSADEVTTPTNPTVTLTANPATNLETAQAAPSEANQATAQASGTQTGTLTNEVTSGSLNTTVSAAQTAGVTISKEASVTHDNLATAQADLASQEVTVKEARSKAEANTKAINDAKATNAQIDADNQAEKERVDALNKAGEAKVAAANQAEKERVDALNAAKKAEVDAYNKAQEAEYTAKKAEYDQQVAEFDKINSQAKGSLPAASNGYTPSNSTTHLKAQSIGGLAFVSTGDLKNPTVYIKGNLDKSKVISSLSWGNVAPEGPGLTKGTYGNPGFYWTGAYNYNTNGTTTQIWTGEVLKWYKIKNAITMLDGTKHDAYIQFHTDTAGLYHESAATKTDGKHVVFWNESGAINSLNGFRQGGANPQSDAIRLTVRVDSPTNNTSYTWLNVMYDIDGGQFIDYDKATTKVLAVGGGMTTNTATSGRAASDENLGFTYGVHRGSNALDGRASSPDGTILYVTQGAQYSTVLRNTAGGNGSAVARADFGANSRITIKPAITPPPVEPKTYTPETPTIKTYTPVTPTVKPHVPVPETETYSVAVHPVFVTQTPTNVKDVVDTDTVSTNGHLVPKGSTQTWTLTNEGLKAGRDTITSYIMDDPFPSGFAINRDATAKANAAAWTVAYKEDGKLQLVATDSTLAALNANKNQDVTVPVAYFVGSPQNDGGTYQNTFTTTVTTPSGEYKVVSNTPVIYTPGNDPKTPRETPDGDNPTPNDNLIQPTKDVLDDNGNSINGQSVLPNTVLHYVAKQDFDQYKGITASKEAIAKGFVYVDDYLDQALDGKSLVVKSITAANGDDVSSLLEMHHVLSPDSIDAKLAELVKASGISPVGEFYLWVAKDPESFFKAYVQKGLDITYNVSFKIKDTFTAGDIKNQTYQLDFGNGYYGNVVVNNLPQLEVHKDVLDKEGKSLDQGTIKIGDEVTYKLEGWVVPTGRSYDLFEYKFVDQLQQTHDLYLKDSVIAKVDITLADGSVIKKGTDLAEYTETVYNKETGLYELAFKKDFLEKVARSSEFGADAFIVVKRIKAGDVYNDYTLYVNGNPVKSNRVVTHTLEDPKPSKPSTPVQGASVATLPQTGEVTSSSLLASALGVMTLGLAGLGLRKKKEAN
ncbi:SspB-related isopeptide-forming adhesin [Streptococcus agalactiae]|uniref:SspB-related isopeptide-forming adhesin n=1 Tax=Streptococcus agalactiae TaxID=1311 RepID=UPI0002BA2A1E|nr:SspB-related isopeptide-forming adhesin [Streptococcus agalactiae]EPT35475.1 hypothetical protein SAG0021_03485 [Streptococcus agalactiae FSL S3-277]